MCQTEIRLLYFDYETERVLALRDISMLLLFMIGYHIFQETWFIFDFVLFTYIYMLLFEFISCFGN